MEIREGEPDVEYPAFVDGERRGPPEDVGGVPGFMEFLEAMLNPFHEEHESGVRWYGRRFEPDDTDERWIRMRLEMVAGRRRGPLMSHRGSAHAPVQILTVQDIFDGKRFYTPSAVARGFGQKPLALTTPIRE